MERLILAAQVFVLGLVTLLGGFMYLSERDHADALRELRREIRSNAAANDTAHAQTGRMLLDIAAEQARLAADMERLTNGVRDVGRRYKYMDSDPSPLEVKPPQKEIHFAQQKERNTP